MEVEERRRKKEELRYKTGRDKKEEEKAIGLWSGSGSAHPGPPSHPAHRSELGALCVSMRAMSSQLGSS